MSNNQFIQTHIKVLEAQIAALQMTVQAMKASETPTPKFVVPVIDPTIELTQTANWSLSSFDIPRDSKAYLTEAPGMSSPNGPQPKQADVSLKDSKSPQDTSRMLNYMATIVRELTPEPFPELEVQHNGQKLIEIFQNLRQNFNILSSQEVIKQNDNAEVWKANIYERAYGDFFSGTAYSHIDPSIRAYMGYFLSVPSIVAILSAENHGMDMALLSNRAWLFSQVAHNILSFMQDWKGTETQKDDSLAQEFFRELAASLGKTLSDRIRRTGEVTTGAPTLGSYKGMCNLRDQMAFYQSHPERLKGLDSSFRITRESRDQILTLMYNGLEQKLDMPLVNKCFFSFLVSDPLKAIVHKYSKKPKNNSLEFKEAEENLGVILHLLDAALVTVEKSE